MTRAHSEPQAELLRGGHEAGAETSSLRHTRPQVIAHFAALMLILAALAVPYPWLETVRFRGGANLHIPLEVASGLFGLVTGLAFLLSALRLGNRLHLYLGLALAVNGLEDFATGVLCIADPSMGLLFVPPRFSGTLRLDELDYQGLRFEFISQTYVTSQLRMALTLLFAVVLAQQRATARPRQLASTIPLVLLLLIALVGLTLQLRPTQVTTTHQFFTRPIDLYSGGLLFLAMGVYLTQYGRRREMLYWWIALSIGVNGIGQLMMLGSTRLIDTFFDLAHAYKLIGYVVPLLGYFIDQINVVRAYERAQRDLITAREAALEATRAKSQFLANVSHEIRTPMNGILGMTEALLRGDLPPRQREQLETVLSSSQSLMRLLNELLDLSKAEAGKITLHPTAFRLREVMAGAVDSLEANAHAKGLMLALHVDDAVPEALVGDAERLRQILLNLIGNAVKFTSRGTIVARASLASVPGALAAASGPEANAPPSRSVTLHFSVSDSGIGIPPSEQARIFDAFHQVDGSVARQFGGTGLGLTIASQLVQLLGGEIWVESEPGRGSTFHFTSIFDLGTDTGPRAAAPARPPLATSRSRRVLVVEDHPVNQRLTMALLEEMGHRAELARDGEEALALLADRPFDVVLLDIQMPGLDGLETARRIRAFPNGHREIPIVAITAHAHPEDRDRCLAAGMNAYLTKPMDVYQLAQTLEALEAAPAPLVDPLETSSLIDQGRLWTAMGGNRRLLGDLAALFLEQLPEQRAAAREAVGQRDAAQLARQTHLLAGAVTNFHADPVTDAIRRLESAAERGSWDAVPSLLAEVELLTDRLVDELGRLQAGDPTLPPLSDPRTGQGA